MMREISKCVELEKYVTKILLGLGVPAHLSGYRYIREAVLISITDMEALNRMTKYLYPEIAEIYNTTPTKVERSVRTAVEASGSWRIFSDTPPLPEGKGPPTANTLPALRTKSAWTTPGTFLYLNIGTGKSQL